MADRNVCLQNAKILDPDAKLCDTWICERNSETNYAFCHCRPPYPAQDPCPYGANSPVAVYGPDGDACWCCCSCFAWHTPIAVPGNETKPIQTFEVGDKVLAAGGDLKWTAYDVEFSGGVPPSPDLGKTMLSVYFQGPNGVQSLVVTPDHVFVLKDKSLLRGEFLVPGQSVLLNDDGSDSAVVGVELGGWYGGVHHIATTESVATKIDGHLLSSKGIVTGDWALQIADIEGGAVKDANIAEAQADVRAGTPAFLQTHDGLEGHLFMHAVPGVDLDAARDENFKPYQMDMSEVPAEAMRFVTRVQAQNIYENAHQTPPSSIGGQDMVSKLFRQMQGFYPDVNFRLDWQAVEPNAFSWTTYDVPFVVINGGLVRTEGMNTATMAVIIAHELGHLYGGAPLSSNGKYSCEGQADYAATAGVLRAVLNVSEYYNMTKQGIEGVKTLFQFIDPANRKGVPGQVCDGISTKCRLVSFEAGLHNKPLPECAGGEKVVFLKLDGAAAAVKAPGKTEVTLTFSEDLDPASALHKDNYSFAPKAKISSVSAVAGNAKSVVLVTDIKDGAAVSVTVQNLLSQSHDTLRENTATASVEWGV